MYEEYYGLTADPFRLTPDASLCFLHPGFQEAKASINYALHCHEGIALITGRPGMGKSTLIFDLTKHLPETVIFTQITSPQLTPEDLLCLISLKFGLSPEEKESSAKLLHSLRCFLTEQHQKGKRTLLIIDEAQNLSEKALEELRLLTTLQVSNKPLLQIFLVGQEKLRATVALPSQIQLRQRITASYHIQPLNENDTKKYILYRLARCNWQQNPTLDGKIFYYIYRFSNGVPRIINLICSRLFLHGWLKKIRFFDIKELHIVIHELVQEQLLPINKTLAEV
jgi:type II secretory pathway predicted ATPase ExeA